MMISLKDKNKAEVLAKLYNASNKPIYIGVDWAAGCGMIRGEVIKRDGNVTHVRFKDVSF